jgi:hypothetical protein
MFLSQKDKSWTCFVIFEILYALSLFLVLRLMYKTVTTEPGIMIKGVGTAHVPLTLIRVKNAEITEKY